MGSILLYIAYVQYRYHASCANINWKMVTIFSAARTRPDRNANTNYSQQTPRNCARPALVALLIEGLDQCFTNLIPGVSNHEVPWIMDCMNNRITKSKERSRIINACCISSSPLVNFLSRFVSALAGRLVNQPQKRRLLTSHHSPMLSNALNHKGQYQDGH
jgi:hypothetical protein